MKCKCFYIKLRFGVNIEIYADELVELKRSVIFTLNGMLVGNVNKKDILSIDF